MKNVITYENLRSFAYSNDAICAQPIRGIALDFIGLNNRDMFDEDSQKAQWFAAQGIVYLHPYVNPWAWMNRQTVAYVDEIVNVLCAHYGLPGDLPIVSTGGSMGGLQALVYMVYAKITPVACVANCPVCDLPFHYTERPDLPRTLYSAFGSYETSLEEALASASPLHLADRLPQAKYYIFHCEQDKAVNKGSHSDKLVDELVKAGHAVAYHAVPDRGHCDLTEEMAALYDAYIVKSIQEAK